MATSCRLSLKMPEARCFSVWLLAAWQLLAACGEERPPYLAPGDSGADADGVGGSSVLIDGGCEEPPAPDAAGYCGNAVIEIVTEKPNLYFVLDASLSMGDSFGSTALSKFDGALLAIRNLLTQLGSRVNYGGAKYPVEDETDVCLEGGEVFATSPGDESTCAALGSPVLAEFLGRLRAGGVSGGTPTSATLGALMPTLAELPGDTRVILLTDGAPNCNTQASCESDECLPDLLRAPLETGVCGIDFMCCDPELFGPEAPQNCVDVTASEEQLSALRDEGILTFVVGMPGTELFARVLDRMAEAGGTPRQESPKYYSVNDTTDLGLALSAIGAEVSVSCTVSLSEAPPEAELVNVYLDGDLVEQDEVNGWAWVDPETVELRGDSCDLVQQGGVRKIQVVAGCPTIIK